MGIGGAMDSCGRCMKTCLVLTNIITFLGGVLAMGLGIWVIVDRSFPSTLLNNHLFLASVGVVVAVGIMLVLLSVLGCCGATKEVKCMLLTYYILLFIMFVVMLIGGILLWVFHEKTVSTVERQLHASIPYYGNRAEYTRAWDDTHTLLRCCGVRNYRDWNDKIPESCCKEVFPGQRVQCQDSPNPTTIWVDGCLDKVIAIFKQDAAIAGSVAIFVALIMLLGLIFSCGLFVKIE